MTPAELSLLALVAAIALSCVSSVNVGLVAIGLAWIVAATGGGLSTEAVFSGFPSQLFLTLVGVTSLFAVAETNGTLERLTRRAFRLARGRVWALPLGLFAIAFLVSSVGPGAVPATALVAPLGMAIGARAGVSPFLCALMVGNGANAGNLSPISAVGLIVSTLMTKGGLPGNEWRVWAAHASAHVLVGAIAYFALGGPRLRATDIENESAGGPALERSHVVTILVTLGWIVSVLAFRANPGLAAFLATALLALLRSGSDAEALRRVPWAIIVMVTGMTVLVSVLEKSGGLDLFTALLARLASPHSANAVVALVTGLISTYSSTSGVVLPAFLPTVQGLVAKLGGGDPLQLALSIIVGGSLVDVSPLSTIGALCVAAHPIAADTHGLYRKLLLWGLSMAVVGAVFCALFAPFFAR